MPPGRFDALPALDLSGQDVADTANSFDRRHQGCPTATDATETITGPKRRPTEKTAPARLLLGDRHDDLCLTRRLEDAAEADDRGNERRLVTVLGLESSEGCDAALEACVDRLQPEAGRTLEDDGQEPLSHEVLWNNEFLDAIAIQVHGERSRLDLVETTS